MKAQRGKSLSLQQYGEPRNKRTGYRFTKMSALCGADTGG